MKLIKRNAVRSLIISLGAGIGILIACSASSGDLDANCEIVDEIESICGLLKPEDIVVAPNGRDIIFSQMVDNGSIAIMDTHTKDVQRLFPGSDSSVTSKELWGEASCTQPSATFKPHGIDLRQRGDGRWQLLVVNHGGRESVEFFELVFEENQQARAIWRGCAEAPDQGNFNDVAGLPDGGFLVTHTADKDSEMWQLFLIQFGVDSGFVYRWDKVNGYVLVPGTEGQMPNGIIVSPDGQNYFLNVYFGNELRKYDLASGELLGHVSVDKPDNLSWAPDGSLLVASQHASLFALLDSIGDKGVAPSLLPFSILEVNPQTLETRVLVHRDGAPMGAGTVAVKVDNYLYIGSYLGDRMIKVAVPAGD